MRERRTLVTNFAALKAGDYVEVVRCNCGSDHRGILTTKDIVDSGAHPTPGWGMEPAPRCANGWVGYGINRHDVEECCVFLIDTGPEDSLSTPTRKKRSVRA